jgi:hypothetical protein
MWQRLTRPDLLVYLDVTYGLPSSPKLDWTEEDYLDQLQRLLHARQHADLYLHTDRMSIKEVLEYVVTFLKSTAQDGHGSPVAL